MTGDAKPAAAEADLGREVEEATRRLEMADLDAGQSTADRVVNGVVEVAGVSVLLTIVLLVFANAVGRYVAGASLIWAEEIVIALIPWLAMTGTFLAIRRRQVIRIEAFTEMMPPALRTALGLFMQLLSAATLTILAYHAFTYVSLFGGDRTVYLRLPTGWFTSAMLIGASACALAYLIDAWRRWRITSFRGRRL